MVILQEESYENIEIGDLVWKPLPRETRQAKFDITFQLTRTSQGFKGVIEYNTGLFKSDTIHRLAGNFRTLITSIVEHPQEKISNLSLLSKSELKQLLTKSNSIDNDADIEYCIPDLFTAQAINNPEAIAIVCNNETITYQQLHQQVNSWANYLQSLGVKPETKVGIVCNRNIKTIIALLAILQAGGCYIPIDPNYPQERINLIVEDTQLKIVLTQDKYAEQLNTNNLTLINIDSFSISQSPNLPIPQSPNNLAYIIYTSGSTGTPKGVEISHRSVIRLVKNPNYVKLDRDTIILQAAPISFDASIFEIWGALLNGGKIVILSNPVLSLEEIADTITKHQVNTVWLTAGLFNLMIDEQLASFSNVHQLLAGGDVLSTSHIQKFLQAHPQCTLIIRSRARYHH